MTTVRISKPAINLREELASLRNQGGLPKEDKLYVETLENGDFSAGTVGWTEYNYLASVSASGGQLTVTSTGTGNGSWAIQKIATKVGKTYKVSAEAVSATTGYIRANNNSIHPWDLLGNASFVSSAGQTRTFTFVAEQDHTFIYLGTGNGSVGQSFTFNSITVQEVGENLVTNGTFDYDANWDKGGTGTVTISGGKVNCTGGMHIVTQSNVMAVGKTYTVSFDYTETTSMRLRIERDDNAATIIDSGSINGTGSGTLSYTFVALSSGIRIAASGTTFTGTIDNVLLTEGNHQVIQSIPHGYDVKDVYIDGELAREGEAYDYQVQTDGINQWLKPTVEPTATTETVVIGVRK